ncbi:cadherin-7-like isoform X4 [Trachinotus anak]|uniref:cadherin-7-like isoform X4 n=1 Tax=Trachinotus anak TaxID=443729 RepID=UPI0039F1CE97
MSSDNTASVLTRRGGFLQQDQLVHFLTVVISDSGSPSLSSTNTLSVTVCNCDLDGHQRSCSQRATPLVVGLSTVAAAAILTCVLTLLGVVMVTVAIRHRKREPLMMNDEREIRENIVRYDDEGGGEEDTEAFDMVALRHLNQTIQTLRDPNLHPPGLPRTPESSMDKNQLFQEFIKDKLQEADLDQTAPPYDSLQTYAFEGNGSTADSLSSLNSLDSLDSLNSMNLLESEQNYDFLREWGPRFRKLADLYGNHEGVHG